MRHPRQATDTAPSGERPRGKEDAEGYREAGEGQTGLGGGAKGRGWIPWTVNLVTSPGQTGSHSLFIHPSLLSSICPSTHLSVHSSFLHSPSMSRGHGNDRTGP